MLFVCVVVCMQYISTAVVFSSGISFSDDQNWQKRKAFANNLFIHLDLKSGVQN